ncbi:glycine-rich cell wall structural protein 1.8-like [Stegodyphus dumicola]|uniref:glycine-rich cell wall structural protein 1.8-like n=1 Tax=Stegodyphus dumicola TaxID=202533 RepID=UPI0015B06BF2|nr:glycine-rich cell wall structural protein 1.8-like [Stegodyphus dumicola]
MKFLVVTLFLYAATAVRAGGLTGPEGYGGPSDGYISRSGYDFKGYNGYAKEVSGSGNRYNGFGVGHCKELNGYGGNVQRLVGQYAPGYGIGHTVGILGNAYNSGGYQRGLANRYVHSNGYEKVLRSEYGLTNGYEKGLRGRYDTASESEKGLENAYRLGSGNGYRGQYEDISGISGVSNIYEKSLSGGYGLGGIKGKTFGGRYENFNTVYGKGRGNKYSDGYNSGAEHVKRPGGGHGLDDEYEKEAFVLNTGYSKSGNSIYSQERAASYILGDYGKEHDVNAYGGYGHSYGYRK